MLYAHSRPSHDPDQAHALMHPFLPRSDDRKYKKNVKMIQAAENQDRHLHKPETEQKCKVVCKDKATGLLGSGSRHCGIIGNVLHTRRETSQAC